MRLTRVIILDRILRLSVAGVAVTLIGADVRSGRPTILLKPRRTMSLGLTKILANFRRGRGGTDAEKDKIEWITGDERKVMRGIR